MKYTVEFEMQSDLGATVGKMVENSLESVLGSIDRLRIVPVRTYVSYVQGNQQTMWTEVDPHGR
jgi:hypothetical protein